MHVEQDLIYHCLYKTEHACCARAAALNEDGRRRKIIVTGCLAQRYSGQLAQDLPEADLVIGFEKYGSLTSSLQAMLGTGGSSNNSVGAGSGSGSGAAGLAAASTSSSAAAPERVQVGEATVPFR